MKKIFKILCAFLSCMCIIFSMTGCLASKEITCGDFVYIPEGEDKAILCRLSTECFNSGKEVIIIPPYLDGREVYCIGAVYYFGSSSTIYSKTMKEVYVPYTVTAIDAATQNTSVIRGDAVDKVCVVSNGLIREHYKLALLDAKINYFITPQSYTFLQTIENNDFVLLRKICAANTSFLFNYKGSPNDDYFYIDNDSYGETIDRPPYEPTREGYIFAGWYKEPECVNAWNFDSDTLPAKQPDADGNTLYQETKLYAKWQKNE